MPNPCSRVIFARTGPWSRSDRVVRNRKSLSIASVSMGEDEAGEMVGMPASAVTFSTMASVEELAQAPTIAWTLSDSTKALAFETAFSASSPVSATSPTTGLPSTPSSLMCSIAISNPRRMGIPCSDPLPVRSISKPIFSAGVSGGSGGSGDTGSFLPHDIRTVRTRATASQGPVEKNATRIPRIFMPPAL